MTQNLNNRYNLFDLIHKGLRALLYNAGLSLQHNNFANRRETISVFTIIDEVLLICDDHASHENRFILPVIARYNMSVVKDMESEHLADESKAFHLKNLMASYRYAINDHERAITGEAMFRAFNEYIAFNMHHMNKEEEELNRLLWLHYSDDEIRCIYKAIIASIPPHKISIHGRWVMRGINNNEIIQWLLSYHGSHPKGFQFLLQLAEEELPDERWGRIKEALCEGEML